MAGLEDMMTKELYNNRNLPDRLVKEAWVGSLPLGRVVNTRLKPDWCTLRGEEVRCLEYENSSRGGFCSHVCKYARLALENPGYEFRVKIIRSIHHQANHGSDFDSAKAAYTAMVLPDLNIEFLNDCGRGEVILEAYHEFSR